MSDLVERLKDRAKYNTCENPQRLMVEAADRIQQLEREISGLQAKIDEMSRADGFHAGYVHGKSVGEAIGAIFARRQAFDEAAQIAEDRTRDFCREGYVLQGPSYLGRTIAAEIRAKAQPHSETRQGQR